MTDKLIIDLFAGGGGASMGIEMALGRSPDIAINHDAVAIAMHAVNHPDTEHYCSDIWAVDPMTVRPGEPVGLIWASPDCKHFSKAKGGKPKDRNIRDLAWVAVDWAEKRKPDVIVIENVEEFRTWGPLDNEGNAIPEFAGQTFEDWVNRLKRAGYKVDWRESRACDYGAPTIRKRLAIIASRIGKPVWPKASHGDPASDAVKAGKLSPWRTAADDVIDWSLPCPSIFDTKEQILEKFGLRAVRPLAHNTGARVARGIRRYVLDASTPFIVDVAHSSVSPDGKVKRWGPGIKTPDAPMGSVTAGGISQAVVAPTLARFNGDSAGAPADGPVPTVTANSFLKRPGGAAPLGVVAPHLMTMRNAGKPFQGADQPTHTVTAGGAGLSLVMASIMANNTNNIGRGADDPVPTVTTGGRNAL